MTNEMITKVARQAEERYEETKTGGEEFQIIMMQALWATRMCGNQKCIDWRKAMAKVNKETRTIMDRVDRRVRCEVMFCKNSNEYRELVEQL